VTPGAATLERRAARRSLAACFRGLENRDAADEALHDERADFATRYLGVVRGEEPQFSVGNGLALGASCALIVVLGDHCVALLIDVRAADREISRCESVSAG
jgi:hypothetical protein